MHFRRMLMNAVDDALTSTPTGAPAPAETPTTPAASTPTLTAADITAALKSDTSLRDAVMAGLRRGGALTGTNPAGVATPAQPPAPQPPAPAAPQASAPSVHQELQRFRALDRAVMSAGVKVSQTQIDRMERAFVAENPQNASEWAAAYVADMFVSAAPPAPPAATTQQPAPTPAQPATPPPTHATSVPTPPAPVVDTSAKRITSMTEGERLELRAKIGNDKFVERLRAEMSSVQVTLRR